METVVNLEPNIIINGCTLTTAQAMTVRVAIGTLAISLEENGLGSDDTGKAICAGYRAAISQINQLMNLDPKEKERPW